MNFQKKLIINKIIDECKKLANIIYIKIKAIEIL